jgi:hypothetical protein
LTLDAWLAYGGFEARKAATRHPGSNPRTRLREPSSK